MRNKPRHSRSTKRGSHFVTFSGRDGRGYQHFYLWLFLPGDQLAIQMEAKQSIFEELCLPHLDAAYNLARLLVGRDADAQNVVQETYVRALTERAARHGNVPVKPGRPASAPGISVGSTEGVTT